MCLQMNDARLICGSGELELRVYDLEWKQTESDEEISTLTDPKPQDPLQQCNVSRLSTLFILVYNVVINSVFCC